MMAQNDGTVFSIKAALLSLLIEFDHKKDIINASFAITKVI